MAREETGMHEGGVCVCVCVRVHAIFVTFFFLTSKKTRIFVLPASRKTWQKYVDCRV